MSRSRAVVIMAAGLGTRMKSETIKVLHEVAGQALIDYPVRQALALGAEKVVVILGHQRARVEAHLAKVFEGAPVDTAVQEEQLGTAHAVLCAQQALAGFEGHVFILSGDVPNLDLETLNALDAHTGDALVGVLGMRLEEPARYGRLVREGESLVRIVEAADCDAEELAIQAVNAGVYRADARFLFEVLGGLRTDNAQGEYYLTDLVAHAAAAGGARALVLEGEAAESLHGVNDRADLARVEAYAQRRLRAALMRAGVTLRDPARVYLHEGVQVGPDTILEPDVNLQGDTRIGRDCVVEQGCRLTDAHVGDGVHLKAYTVAEDAIIEDRCAVGPFARLRTGTRLGEKVKVGNFVETKKAEFGPGAKASHLSYLGDASIGAGANIGAGTITCNYDGYQKYRTVIGERAFIGSDTQLVAPVTVGDDAFVGAGSTVTEDVESGHLALSRTRQKSIGGWVARFRARMEED